MTRLRGGGRNIEISDQEVSCLFSIYGSFGKISREFVFFWVILCFVGEIFNDFPIGENNMV